MGVGTPIFHSSGPTVNKVLGCPMPTGCLKDGTGIYSIKIGTTVPHLKSRKLYGAGQVTAIPTQAIGNGTDLYSWTECSATAGQKALAGEGMGPLGFIAKASGANDYETARLFQKGDAIGYGI